MRARACERAREGRAEWKRKGERASPERETVDGEGRSRSFLARCFVMRRENARKEPDGVNGERIGFMVG